MSNIVLTGSHGSLAMSRQSMKLVLTRRSLFSASMSMSMTCNCGSLENRSPSHRMLPFSAMIALPPKTRSVDDSP